MQLHEEERPRDFCQLVGHKRVLARLNAIRKRGIGGRAFWISGPSGTGKTTIARLLAAEIADKWCIEEADATDLTAARVREIEDRSHTLGMGRGGRAWIVNEAHAMNKRVVRQFLTTLERIPGHVIYVFTTTCAGQELLFEDQIDAGPLVSRCTRLSLETTGLDVFFARRARNIARRHGMDTRPLHDYVELLRKHELNLRSVLQEIEAGVFSEGGRGRRARRK
jgi:DNA polymerase-3 subunit gamma/tau